MSSAVTIDRAGRPIRRALVPGVAGAAACALWLLLTAPAIALQVTGQPAVEDEGALPPASEPQAPVSGQDGTVPPEEEFYGPQAAPVEAIPAEDSAVDPFAAMLTQRGPSAIRLSSRAPQLYKTTEGDETFLFQAEGRRGLIRFPCEAPDDTLECALVSSGGTEETLILTSTRSPRGDVTWSDQSGAAVLRVTSNGGATLFAPDEMARSASADQSMVPLGGRAVLPVSRASGSLKPQQLSFRVASERMRRASDLLNERHGTAVTFMAPGRHIGDQGVLADAVLTAAKGIDLVAGDQLGSRIVSERLAVVEFRPNVKSGLALQEGTLTVSYNPAGGVAGRPSSITVARYLEANL